MKTLISMLSKAVILMLLFVFTGCSSPCTSPVTLHACRYPVQAREQWVPDYQGEMTLAAAFDLLQLTPPVEVDFFSSLKREDVLNSAEDDIRGLLHDAEGKYIGFRRIIAYTNETFTCENGFESLSVQSYPSFLLLNYRGLGLDELMLRGFELDTIHVDQSDPRLKAFSLVALDWVYKQYTPTVKWSVLPDNAIPSDEADAGYVLHLFEDAAEEGTGANEDQGPLVTDGNLMQAVMLIAPNPKPSWKGTMTPTEAAALLGLRLPVVASGFAGFEDGGTVIGAIRDIDGNVIAFRRSPWTRPPIVFYLTFLGKDSLIYGSINETKMKDEDPRLKAFAVLALDWVEKRFTKTQINRIREEIPPLKQSTARNILNLFEKTR
jgi:hypothetical protein